MSDFVVELNPKDFFPELEKKCRAMIGPWLDDVADALLGQISVEAPKGMTGFLHQAYNWRVLPTNEFTRTVQSMAPYAYGVHEGRAPEEIKDSEREGIMRWAEWRGLPPYAVWRNIKRYGTAPNNFADRAIEWLQTRDLSAFIKGDING